MSDLILKVSALCIGYVGKEVVQLVPAIDFNIRSGQIVSIVGHNGSGKSTLLKTLVGLNAKLSGEIELLKTPLAYVPQRDAIDPIYPVRVDQICQTGCYASRGVGRFLSAADRRGVEEALELMGVRRLAKQLFRTLSGGEQQRVLIARALVMKPALMVLDEPTANMDFKGAAAVMSIAQDLARSRGVAILMVNHFLDIVNQISDQVVLLDRDHQKVLVGDPSTVLRGLNYG